MNAASFTKVTKNYGRHTALREASFSIPQGVICGLIGPNGAGKTTTMGVLAGLLRPQSGNVDVLGQGAFSIAKHAGRIGIMPQDSVPSPHAPISDSLVFYARLQGMSPKSARQEADTWLGRVQLKDRAHSRYTALSHGMRRRFSVAQAMLGTPELILLDEPTSGLDPELVVEIRNLILELRGQCTVLVSSHILSELESMCDHAIFLERGECVREGAMTQITGQGAVTRYRLDQEPNLAALEGALADCKLNWKAPYLTVRAPGTHKIEQLNAVCLRHLLDAGIGITELTSGDSLESAYMETRQ